MESIYMIQEDYIENVKKAFANYKKTPKARLCEIYVETKLESLEQISTKFYKSHCQIVGAISKEEKLKCAYFQDDIYNKFEEIYLEYKIKLKEDLMKFKVNKESLNSDSIQTATCIPSQSEIRLPQINLPSFKGNYEEWESFRDMFNSLIHSNKSINSVQKLHYLKSCLSGDPSKLILNLNTTESNYEEAWKQLNKRYNNKRYIINEAMKRLFTQKFVTSDSASAVKQLLDTTMSCLKSLNNLNIKTESWDTIINFLVLNKLDTESRKLWELKINQNENDEIPTWEDLINFLESRFRTLEMIQECNPKKQPTVKHKSYHCVIEENQNKNLNCVHCNKPHLLYQCEQFQNQSPEKRIEFIQSKRLCFNCFASTHSVKKCHRSTCCRQCGRRHHTLLHIERTATQGLKPENQKVYSDDKETLQPPNEKKILAHFAANKNKDVLLATALANICAASGYRQLVRVLIDQGSEASFVSEDTVQRLGLKKFPVNAFVSGIGSDEMRVKSRVLFNLESIQNPNFSVQVEAFVVSTLTSILPTNKISVKKWSEIEHLPLADPKYGVPGGIDVILGVEIYSEIILSGLLRHPCNSSGPIAQNTQFGWVLSGRIENPTKDKSERILSLHIRVKEDEILTKFWEIEKEPNEIYRKMTKEELECEQLFDKTTIREENGRYKVCLPFKDPEPRCLNNNLNKIVLHRFGLLERKLNKDTQLKEDYKRAIEDYIDQNHMEEIINKDEINNYKSVYLPFHAVIKRDRETTKIRIVYDASCKGSNNLSLNDTFLVGPKLQQDLRHILMRWRCHRYCIISDICQMFRQVLVNEAHTDYQRIYWRNSQDEQIRHYRLLRLTFGTACAPYLAVKTLQQLAKDERKHYPTAAKIVLEDFYIDDLLTGAEDEDSIISIYEELNKLMNLGGFKLQKWCTNSEQLSSYITSENQSANETIFFKTDNVLKVLGIFWNRLTDTFEYSYKIDNTDEKTITKRRVLSDIARLYDPLGWIAPVIVKSKLFMQKLWKSKLAWDDNLSLDSSNEWFSFKNDLHNVKFIKIPRWINSKKSYQRELHVFSDASSYAYAAAVYIKIKDEEQNIFMNLVTAKTKVAPIDRELSIPRLELCGALLASKLIHEVSVIMKIPKDKLFAWTDSTIVLAWIKGEPTRWNTFVSNRVSEILTILDNYQWNHIPTNQNPADPASRGLSSKELIHLKLWWHGPERLSSSLTVEPKENEFTTEEEVRAVKTFTTILKPKENFIWNKFSSLEKALRVLSYCRRFYKQKSKNKYFSKIVSTKELDEVSQICIKAIQNFYFEEDIKNLRANKNMSKKSNIYILNPFFDKNGVLRVGGRVMNAQVSYDKKHPIIMPYESHFTRLTVLQAHNKTLHGGPQIMLNYLRSKFWILKGRILVKKIYRECVTCIRYGKQNNSTLMGQLPTVRLTPSKPFRNTGVDFTGHINIRFSPGRGSKSFKGYICIFICMATKAIHLEAVSDLSSKGFIAAFRRFTSRRGYCQNIYSDNATNFVGAKKELGEMHNRSISQLPIEFQELLRNDGTTWHFIPPQAPHFGGLWEAGVRSTKTHLKKIIGNSTLTFEELCTVLTQIEACLNSRPISYISDSPNDPLPLTPAHFLVGEPLISIPDEDHSGESNLCLNNRWKFCQRLVNSFWNKWSKEYLVTLSNRHKWTVKSSEIKIGNIVIVKEDNLPPAKWLLGKVIQTHPGQDGVTRVVTIKTKLGISKRPIVKLCKLLQDTENVN